MKLKLTNEERDSILSLVSEVLSTGSPWGDINLHHPAGAIIDAVLSINGVEKSKDRDDGNDGFDQNGWQWDWWQTFVYEGKKYVLSGSGFYGGHTFHKADE